MYNTKTIKYKKWNMILLKIWLIQHSLGMSFEELIWNYKEFVSNWENIIVSWTYLEEHSKLNLLREVHVCEYSYLDAMFTMSITWPANLWSGTGLP